MHPVQSPSKEKAYLPASCCTLTCRHGAPTAFGQRRCRSYVPGGEARGAWWRALRARVSRTRGGPSNPRGASGGRLLHKVEAGQRVGFVEPALKLSHLLPKFHHQLLEVLHSQLKAHTTLTHLKAYTEKAAGNTDRAESKAGPSGKARAQGLGRAQFHRPARAAQKGNGFSKMVIPGIPKAVKGTRGSRGKEVRSQTAETSAGGER